MQNFSSQSAQLAVSSWLCPSLPIHCTWDGVHPFGKTLSPGQPVPSCILQLRGCNLYTYSFSCCDSQHQHTASGFCLHADGSADLLRVAVAQVKGLQTGSRRVTGTAIASDKAVPMLYARLHSMLRYTGTVWPLWEWIVYAHTSCCWSGPESKAKPWSLRSKCH
jgi:hypothetical protein